MPINPYPANVENMVNLTLLESKLALFHQTSHCSTNSHTVQPNFTLIAPHLTPFAPNIALLTTNRTLFVPNLTLLATNLTLLAPNLTVQPNLTPLAKTSQCHT